jgi:hypothetical protein
MKAEAEREFLRMSFAVKRVLIFYENVGFKFTGKTIISTNVASVGLGVDYIKQMLRPVLGYL